MLTLKLNYNYTFTFSSNSYDILDESALLFGYCRLCVQI